MTSTMTLCEFCCVDWMPTVAFIRTSSCSVPNNGACAWTDCDAMDMELVVLSIGWFVPPVISSELLVVDGRCWYWQLLLNNCSCLLFSLLV